MILTLTPNPALDITYRLEGFAPHQEHRALEVRERPGGKGVNVARVLLQLGHDVLLAGPLGGATGNLVADLLEHPGPADRVAGSGRPHPRWTPIAGETRRTLTLVDPRGVTGVNEPGPRLLPREQEQLERDVLRAVADPAADVRAVAVSGSLPPGFDQEALPRLVRRVRESGRAVLVDTSGPSLLAAARAGASLLKPNRAEALAATGAASPLEAALVLLGQGARAVVVSLGEDGMLLVDGTGPVPRAHRARTDPVPGGNPTGAGDSAVAELVLALAERRPLLEALPRAVATSAATVARPSAGEFDPALRPRLLDTVTVEEIPCP